MVLVVLLCSSMAPCALKAQTMTIANTSTEAIALNPYYATTCTPPGTQGISCISVGANGGTNTYTPPSGNVWYGFKIYCSDCTGAAVGSVNCASGTTSVVCGTTTIYISGDATRMRIYQ